MFIVYFPILQARWSLRYDIGWYWFCIHRVTYWQHDLPCKYSHCGVSSDFAASPVRLCTHIDLCTAVIFNTLLFVRRLVLVDRCQLRDFCWLLYCTTKTCATLAPFVFRVTQIRLCMCLLITTWMYVEADNYEKRDVLSLQPETMVAALAGQHTSKCNPVQFCTRD